MARPTHLRVYRFDEQVSLDGGLVRALEQIELTADAGLLDMLFVTRADAGGELQAIDLATSRADGTMATLLDFRLDPSSRRATTRRTLQPHPGGVPAAVVETVGGSLAPGSAVLAALVAGQPAALDDAVTSSGGRLVADAPVAASALGDVAPRLCAAL